MPPEVATDDADDDGEVIETGAPWLSIVVTDGTLFVLYCDAATYLL
jgi:hypothetical protein